MMLVVLGGVLPPARATAQESPNPVLSPTGIEPFLKDGKPFLKYKFEISNRDVFPPEMFAAAPELPPCGKNTKASRTWVDVYDSRGTRLNGFCALNAPGQLADIWFALEEGMIPPSFIYIELTDRKTNKKYKSNEAETSL
jgi:hypothetical protein